MLSRNRLIATVLMLTSAFAGTGFAADGSSAITAKLNIVLITADDLNHDSLGCYGCPIRDITPNLDRLASEGMRVARAYSTVAVCQPVRQTMLTGLYPHRSGSLGFFPIQPHVRTLNQQFRDAGYKLAMLGKNPHYQPRTQFCLDFEESQISRDPAKLAEVTREFIQQAQSEGKPFVHFVNCTDPHRPFIGTNGPKDLAHGTAPSRYISVDEVPAIPGFLENLPEIRRELAQYYTSVRRLDDCVGAVLKVIDDLKLRDNTLVMFYGGDHGMSFPFAKSNDYEDSSRGALLIRWPGTTQPGSVDERHLVSTVDFTPTLLEAAGLTPLPDRDGRSFVPALRGETMTGWDHVFTCYNATSGSLWVPIRCLRTKDRSYIWNAWSDGTTEYRAENMNGLTWKAMLAAAKTNAEIKARCDFYLHRVPEEFYDLKRDRYERTNLIDDPDSQATIDAMRAQLLEIMQRTQDPFADAFAQRDRREVYETTLAKVKSQFVKVPKAQRGKANNDPLDPDDVDSTAPSASPPAAARVMKGRNANLIEFELANIKRLPHDQPITVKIKHAFPDNSQPRAITVTVKSAGNNTRLERKVIQVTGTGTAEVTFGAAAAKRGQSVRIAAFVGEDFNTTPQQILSAPLSIE